MEGRYNNFTMQKAYNPTKTHRVFHILLWFTFPTLLAFVAAYYQMFSGFKSYDDEGTMMMWVKFFLRGHKLYTDLLTTYGPLYYFYQWGIHTLFGAPVTHNVTRFAAIVPMLVCPLVCAWIIFQFHRSIWLA